MHPNAVIFDFDFTLADSSKAIVECVAVALSELGFEAVPPEKIVETVGLTLGDTLTYLTGISDGGLARRFAQYFHHRADEIMNSATVMYESVRPVMRCLRTANLRTAIVSTKLNYRIKGILAANSLEKFVDVIVGADDVTNPKPDPEGLILAVRRLGVSPERAVYVGDHVVDAEAADNAGIFFIAVLSGRHLVSDFQHYAPCAIVESIRDLPQVLGLSQ